MVKIYFPLLHFALFLVIALALSSAKVSAQESVDYSLWCGQIVDGACVVAPSNGSAPQGYNFTPCGGDPYECCFTQLYNGTCPDPPKPPADPTAPAPVCGTETNNTCWIGTAPQLVGQYAKCTGQGSKCCYQQSQCGEPVPNECGTTNGITCMSAGGTSLGLIANINQQSGSYYACSGNQGVCCPSTNQCPVSKNQCGVFTGSSCLIDNAHYSSYVSCGSGVGNPCCLGKQFCLNQAQCTESYDSKVSVCRCGNAPFNPAGADGKSCCGYVYNGVCNATPPPRQLQCGQELNYDSGFGVGTPSCNCDGGSLTQRTDATSVNLCCGWRDDQQRCSRTEPRELSCGTRIPNQAGFNCGCEHSSGSCCGWLDPREPDGCAATDRSISQCGAISIGATGAPTCVVDGVSRSLALNEAVACGDASFSNPCCITQQECRLLQDEPYPEELLGQCGFINNYAGDKRCGTYINQNLSGINNRLTSYTACLTDELTQPCCSTPTQCRSLTGVPVGTDSTPYNCGTIPQFGPNGEDARNYCTINGTNHAIHNNDAVACTSRNPGSDCCVSATECTILTGSEPPPGSTGPIGGGSQPGSDDPTDPANPGDSETEEGSDTGFNIFAGPNAATFAALNPLTIAGSRFASQFSSPAGILNRAILFIFPLSGLLLFLMLVWGGFEIVQNAHNQKGLQAGKQRITAALIGFGLLFGSFWIVQIIEYIFGLAIL